MSTANFVTMRDFSLYARDFIEELYVCPECGQTSMNNPCEYCGAECSDDPENMVFEYDESESFFVCRNVKEEMERFNDSLLFHRVVLRSGYYSGYQFFVETLHDVIEDDYSNDDCRIYFDLCRSVAQRKFRSEINRIRRFLKALASRYCFNEYRVAAQFSNGEVWYDKVG